MWREFHSYIPSCRCARLDLGQYSSKTSGGPRRESHHHRPPPPASAVVPHAASTHSPVPPPRQHQPRTPPGSAPPVLLPRRRASCCGRRSPPSISSAAACNHRRGQNIEAARPPLCPLSERAQILIAAAAMVSIDVDPGGSAFPSIGARSADKPSEQII